ncbi:MAG: hypothetical protein PHT94_00180 [Candidatus Nanoarchaeia archaeon]|nr:hypothetical protein [Candidatus Nanoarchaeia archaeon]
MKNKIILNLANQFNDLQPNSIKNILLNEDKVSSNNRFHWVLKKVNKKKIVIVLYAQDYSSIRAGLNAITNIINLIKKGDEFGR